MAPSSEHRNALAGETSPYLLQHARNPVDWYPWGAEALARARDENRPLLLSIGYSACHWCHVMAHESFEDETTARLMNALFVNVKVDREERPDLDQIYQLAHQLLTGRPGGWPLTVFLTPDRHEPFFAGTYFPGEPRFGMPAFGEVLTRVASFYQQHEGEVQRQNAALRDALRRLEQRSTGEVVLTPVPLARARAELEHGFDDEYGGFGAAPKFPHPSNIERLLRHHAAEPGDRAALHMAVHSLRCMARGGIYDQLGGGFCRYSVDREWQIPHFEKMLYDNGPLLALCAEAATLTDDPLLGAAARATGDWMLREMSAPEGGMYASLDADSEGEEGRFYVWERGELRAALDAQAWRAVEARYGLDRPANFEGSRWNLVAARDMAEVAAQLDCGLEQATAVLEHARGRMLAMRAERVRPGRDEKVLASWNALAIKGLAQAGRLLAEPRFVDQAERAFDFVTTNLLHDGRLRAVWKDGRARFPAYLDDHAFLLDAALALLETHWRRATLDHARDLADTLLAHFEDRAAGGFFFTADDHERLIHRHKPYTDDALPSGNGIAALALGRLGHLLGEMRYIDASTRALHAAWPSMERMPSACATLLNALDEHLDPPRIVILRGTDDTLDRWQASAREGFAPRRMVLAIPAAESELPGLLGARIPQGECVAYVCEGTRCLTPITDLAALEEALRGPAPG